MALSYQLSHCRNDHKLLTDTELGNVLMLQRLLLLNSSYMIGSVRTLAFIKVLMNYFLYITVLDLRFLWQ